MLGELTDIGREVRVFRVACFFLTELSSPPTFLGGHYDNYMSIGTCIYHVSSTIH